MVILRAHPPGRVGERVFYPDQCQLVPGSAPERPARGGHQQAGHRDPSSSAVPSPSRRAVARHWWMAQCSESTGTISAPGVRRARCTTGAPAISDSLLARASRRPASSAARVTGRPAKPTTPFTTTSAGCTGGGQALGPGHHLGSRRDPRGHVGRQSRVADRHEFGTEPRAPARPAGPPSAGRPGPPPGTGRARRSPPRPPGCRSSPWTRPGSPSSCPSTCPSPALDQRPPGTQHAIGSARALAVTPGGRPSPGSTSPAARTAARRPGRAGRRGPGRIRPMSFSPRCRLTSDSERSPRG